MKTPYHLCGLLSFCIGVCQTLNATDYYASLTGGHVPPFSNWTDAATNIQAAIDAASSGDTVWVTNGVYATGGKAMAGNLTNRVALDKALAVRSLNGPEVTTIKGLGPAGPGAVRCAWVTNGAQLVGFTLREGATRDSGDDLTLRRGGGVWCVGTNAAVSNCIVFANTANTLGGGGFQGRWQDCVLEQNTALNGAGAAHGVFLNCQIKRNTAISQGGGLYFAADIGATLVNCLVSENRAGVGGGVYSVSGVGATMVNCAITRNSATFDCGGISANRSDAIVLTNCTIAFNRAGGTVGGIRYGTLRNCIVFQNAAPVAANYDLSTFQYSCSLPLPGGTGNFTSDPQLLEDGIHVSESSPCRGAGSVSFAVGVDFDGQSWSGPPAVGCDEWHPEPVAGALSVNPAYETGLLSLTAPAAGQAPFAFYWFKDSTLLAEDSTPAKAQGSTVLGQLSSDSLAGNYRVVVSNALGCSTSAVTRLTLHYVNVGATAPSAPFSGWATAATTIQAAIDSAGIGDVVVVTNGVYDFGGKVMAGDLMNRVAVDKVISVVSLEGAEATTIRGVGPNGTNAVRCAWVDDGARLHGFTLSGGATRITGDANKLCSGGGVWSPTIHAMISACRVTGNSAYSAGGGAYLGSLLNCTVQGNSTPGNGGGTYNSILTGCRVSINSANTGGGAYGGVLKGCAVTGNTAQNGGGANLANLTSCTVTRNTAAVSLGGLMGGNATNCVVYFNSASVDPKNYNGVLFHSCAYPLALGTGNIAADPQFLEDGLHLGPTSPCIGAGTAALATGTDIDGQPWSNPPAMGCDEYRPDPVLALGPELSVGTLPGTLALRVFVIGEEPLHYVWLKDGTAVSDGAYYAGTQTRELSISAFDPSVVGNYLAVVSNSLGVVTSSVARLNLHFVSAAAAAPTAPFTNWATAASSIQDAIDTAEVGACIVVSNGVYATGGRVMAGGMTNRVVLDKAITVIGIGEASETVIQGAWDPATTNGPLAVRCAWLTNGATLAGVTLQGGATRSSGDQFGGGAWCASTNAFLVNCVLRGNSAVFGGGCYQGTVVRSQLVENRATSSGGGAHYSTLSKCRVTSNRSAGSGGGASYGILEDSTIDQNTANTGGGAYFSAVNRCEVVSNRATSSGGGIAASTTAGVHVSNSRIAWNTAASTGGGILASTGSIIYNCTVVANDAAVGGGVAGGVVANSIVVDNWGANYQSAGFLYSCTTPLPTGPGNISTNPMLLGDLRHIATNSPCRGAGTTSYSSVTFGLGTDLDGQPWGNPPSIGCDEWKPEPVLTSVPSVQTGGQPGSIALSAAAGGQEPFTYGWLKDGMTLTNDVRHVAVDGPTLAIDGFDVTDAGSYQLVVSNAFGVVTSQLAQVSVHCVNAAGTLPVTPFTNWLSAATNIQDAIDAASPGSVILVTNGVYALGGKAINGGITNRVVVDKPLALTSVNGPDSTVIKGAWDPATTNGTRAVRAVWLANGASISGFTITGGATRAGTSTPTQEMNGGGVYGTSSLATVSDCIITGNQAGIQGGGAYGVTLKRCTLSGNIAIGYGTTSGSGGGAANCVLRNCFVTGNKAWQYSGGGTYNCTVLNSAITENWAGQYGGGLDGGFSINSTVVGNRVGDYFNGYGGGASRAVLTNCIVYANIVQSGTPSTSNHYNASFAFSCAAPLPAGTGNLAVDPQLLADRIHLASTSPCLGAGTNLVVSGTDIDGQSWSNSPAMGCDEWHPEPVCIAGTSVRFLPQARTVSATVACAGQDPFTCLWSKDGEPITEGLRYTGAGTLSLRVNEFDLADAGAYRVIVSNAFGVTTSQVARLMIHAVNAANPTPSAPYTEWSSAATNIQDAINAADNGDFILVTNGVYAYGGRVMYEDLTNRVALYKPVTVTSVNGPKVTVIQGAWDAVTTNGPGAVRCAWVTNGATLSGFTLTRGATRAAIDSLTGSGGGVWCTDINGAVVANCLVLTNSAYSSGGGSRFGFLVNCAIQGNFVTGGSGGGAIGGKLVNCTITGNRAASFGGGQQDATLTNCIVYHNRLTASASSYYADNGGGALRFSCSPWLTSGLGGNISADPQLLDGFHLAATSPCRNAGTNIASGTDLDGEPWANPPSMGCDEVWEAGITGALAVAISAPWPAVAERGSLPLTGLVEGRATRVSWDFGDDSILTNQSLLNTSHVWTNAGIYNVLFTAFNTDHPGGVSTNLDIHVVPLLAPTISGPTFDTTNLSFNFQGQPGVSYWVDQATNLVPPVEWKPWRGLSSTGQVMQVIDPATTNDMQFYRIRVP